MGEVGRQERREARRKGGTERKSLTSQKTIIILLGQAQS